MSARPSRCLRRDGIVLVVVLFFALLLSSTVASFARKALIDKMIVHNRNARSEADALARGGIRLAEALILEGKLRQKQKGLSLDHRQELWALASGRDIPVDDRGTLSVEIEDVAARLNLNAVVTFEETGNPTPLVQPLLQALFEKAVEDIPVPPGEKVYDLRELADNLVDYIDPDTSSLRGGFEDAAYQDRDPPTRPANRPLLSVDELRRVEGFDARLVEALRPYVTVYPYIGGGINLNTAPPHVLALLFFNDGVEMRMADEGIVRQILEAREQGGLVCGEDQSGEGCTPIGEIVTNAQGIYPEPRYTSEVFVVRSRAQVGEITHRIEAVVDLGEGASPELLSWQVR